MDIVVAAEGRSLAARQHGRDAGAGARECQNCLCFGGAEARISEIIRQGELARQHVREQDA
jgi:hypothetical protein